MKILFILLNLLIIIKTIATNQIIDIDPFKFIANNKKINSEKEWWQTATFYQIYPRSFKDSDGDGIGDLNGITEKLPYLKELGINATWLSPIFKSPLADFGYDISNFFQIQPEYGTLNDFKKMVNRANELGIKIILDFVPNHSSDENEWFKKSVDQDPIYKDFYVWHPGYPDPNNSSNRIPPSNWLSFFWKSAWEWNDKRKEFYLHQFHKKQPDLNYRNQIVVEVMKSVLVYWMDHGVDGFRIDAVPALFEIKKDKQGRYKDEPKSGYTNNTDDPSFLLHIYTQDQDETLDMVYQWRLLLDDYQDINGGERKVMLTESYSKIDIVMKYYGDGKSRNGSNIPFNFNLITNLNNYSRADEVKGVVDLWMNNMPIGRTANWVIGNHDQRRAASRYGEDRIDSISMIELTLPGVGIIYNGEEIGMTDVWISWNDTKDPQACNTNPQIYEKYTRDPERTPFQWDDTTSAGFSTNKSTWLPVSSKYKTVNVKLQTEDKTSHLKVYQSLIKLRQTETLKNGNFDIKTVNNNVIIIQRYLDGYEAYITIANWGSEFEKIDLQLLYKNIPDQLIYEIVSVNSKKQIGSFVKSSNIILQPNESFVLRTEGSKFFDYFLDFN